MLAPGDTVIVTDGKKNQVGVFTGNLLVGKTVTVYDNTVRIYLKSVQTESTNEYGFKVFNVYAPLAEGKYRVIFSTDDIDFGGMDRTSKDYVYYTKFVEGRGLGFEIYIPCRTAIVFRKID